MFLPDVNFWLALTLSKHAHHEEVRDWLESETSSEAICFCRQTQQGLLRLLTTGAVCAPYGIPPLSNREAWNIYAQFMRNDRFVFAHEPPGIEPIWKSFASGNASSPKLWMDAYLAAFAIASDATLVTLDRAFAAFEKKGLELVLLQ